MLLTLLVAGCTQGLFAQERVVTGRVIDAETGRPVSGAAIRVAESLTGCTTNNEGLFKLSLPEHAERIRISHLAYEPESYRVTQTDKDIEIRLVERYVNMNPVVVTGTGTHRRMDNTPIPVQVYSAKDLRTANVTNVQEAMMKLNPSVSFMTNGMGTTMSMNGLTDRYILVLENGKRLAGDDTYTRIDMANVKRIEVLSGAASALYGSDAIAGVINIITDDAQNNANVTSNTRYGSHNQFTQSVNADFQVGKFGSFTSYQRQQSDGWQLNPYTEDNDGNLVATNKEASTAYHSNTIGQRFTFDPTDRLSFYLRGNIYTYTTDRPMPMGDNTTNYDMRHGTYTYGAGAQYMINKKSYLNADYFSDNHSTYKDYFTGDDMGTNEMTKRIHHHNLNVKGIFQLGQYNKLSTGFEYIRETLSSESDNIEWKGISTMALYAQDEVNFNKHFQGVVGLRYIYHQSFHSYATPNVALLYKVGGFNFRGSYASGFHSPELVELYTFSESKRTSRLTIGNENLKPEKSDNLTLSAEYTNRNFSVSASGFYNHIRDMINYREFSKDETDRYNQENGTDFASVQIRDNIQSATIKGFNVRFDAYIGAGFSMNGGYTFVDAKDNTNDRPVDKSVKHSGVVAALWNHTWNKYTLNVNFNGRIQGERFSQSYGYAPKFSLWNLNTSHRFVLKDFILEPGVGIENLFDYVDDRPYNSNYATLTPGRTYYVSLLVKFNK